MSIRWKFIAVCILIVFVPIFFLNKYSIDFFDRFTRTALEEHMIDHAFIIGNELAARGVDDLEARQALQARIESYGKELNTRIQIVATNGTVLADSQTEQVGADIGGLKEVALAMQGQYGARNQLTPDHQYMYYYIALPIKNSDGETLLIAHLSRHTSHIIGAINRMIRSHRVAYALSLGVAAIIAVLTALTLIHPLRRLTRAAQAYAGGERQFKCRIRGRDEIAQLQKAIKSMTEEIERKNTYNREFLATAAHELKTPLAAIQAAAEVLAGGAFENPAAREKFIANIQFETKRLDRLVGELRELTRFDAESVRRQSEVRDCDELFEEILGRILSTLPDEKARIELRKSGEKLRLRVVPEQIEQVLSNLLENAVRYTPADGSIAVAIHRADDETAAVSVKDSGCGIAPELQQRIFEQFFTTEAQNGSNAHGSGLGLAIAKSIIENHGGRIAVASSPGQGAEFTFNLPLARRG